MRPRGARPQRGCVRAVQRVLVVEIGRVLGGYWEGIGRVLGGYLGGYWEGIGRESRGNREGKERETGSKLGEKTPCDIQAEWECDLWGQWGRESGVVRVGW